MIAILICACACMLTNDDRRGIALRLQSAIPEKGTHGFIKVDNDGSDIFYWHFPARNNPETAPLAFWFQGGPGSSSLYGMLFENGPFIVNKTGVFINDHSWNTDLNMVYIDNPIGTGFSSSSVRDMPTVAENIQDKAQIFFESFYDLYPAYKGRDLYLTGESYAGHHLPYISHRLHAMMATNKDVALKGVVIGNGWVSSGLMYLSYPMILLKTKAINQTWHDELMAGMITCKNLMDYDPKFAKSAAKDFCDYMYTKAISYPSNGTARFNDYDMRKQDDYDDDAMRL
jgi:carboxypeptidase C (cathepsin A)